MLSRALVLTAWLVSLAMGSASAQAEPAKLSVREITGDVTITTEGRPQRPKVGFVFAAPAEVRTGRDGSVLLADSATTLKVAPGTIVDIPASAQPSGMLDRILQRSGSVLYNVNSRNGRPFAVETALLTSVVKGTLFSINVQEQSAVVALLEGSLDVSAPGESEHVLLTPGDAARRGAGDRGISVERRAAAAVERAPARAASSSPIPAEFNESGGMARASDDLARVTAAIGLAPPSAAPMVSPPVSQSPPANAPVTTPGGGAALGTPTQPAAPTDPAPTGTPASPVPPASTAPAAESTTSPPPPPPATTPPATTTPATTPPSTDGDGGSRKGRGRGLEQGHGKGNDDPENDPG